MCKQYHGWPLLLLGLLACNEAAEVSPKPYAFHRIDLPEVAYENWKGNCPFSFEKAKAAKVVLAKDSSQLCWINLEYPALHATVYITYGVLDQAHPLGKYIAEAQRLTYKHTIKASSIEEIPILQQNKRVFGLYYKVGGNAASNSQFYLTDSARHFVRGSVYFYSTPRADSLAPVVAYVQQDIERLLQSFTWH